MQDTEPFDYLGFLPIAIFLIGAAFMVMQGGIDSAMKFTNIEASGSNVAIAKNFYLMNQGDRFGKFKSGQLEDLKLEGCEFDLPGYIEQRPKHKVDDSCGYYKKSSREKRADKLARAYAKSENIELPEEDEEPRLRTLAVVEGEDSPRLIVTTIPLEVTNPKTARKGEGS